MNLIKKIYAWHERQRVTAQLSEADRRYEADQRQQRAMTADGEADWESQKAALVKENRRLAEQAKNLAVKLDRVAVSVVAFQSKLSQAETREAALAKKLSDIENQGFAEYMNALVSRSEAAQ